ncbi:MAG: DUF5686 family protein [Bacteroidales bacterium]
MKAYFRIAEGIAELCRLMSELSREIHAWTIMPYKLFYMQLLPGLRLLVLICFAGFFAGQATGQVTRIMGRVVDGNTGEPVPFANIYFSDHTIGATSGFNGEFSIETRRNFDTVYVSFVGYRSQARKIIPGVFQEMTIALQPAGVQLNEVVIRPGENPAEVLLRKVIKNKALNNREAHNACQHEVYTKIQFDANNIDDRLRERRFMKPFKFVFDYVDTSIVNGKSYLPVFISETLSDHYYSKDPPGEIEIIKASRVSGIENESITQFLGDLYQNVNIYDNYIPLFEKNFVSPIADFGLGFYKYYLIDSAFMDGYWCYHMMFKPKRKQELTFTGELWIHDTSFAVKSLDMKVTGDANLNFVNDLALEQAYELLENDRWTLIRDYIVVDFNIIENTDRILGFFGHRTTIHRNFVFNQPKQKEFYRSPVDVVIQDDARTKSDAFWDTARHERLTEKEMGIYEMVDSVKNVPLFRTYVDFFYMLFNGNLLWGNIEIGPYYKMLSFNEIEGVRFRLGGCTSNEFSTKLMLSGHVAYGTKDRKFKYNLGFLYLFSKNPRRGFGAGYTHDMEQLGASQNAFSEDNLFSSFFRRSPANKLSMVQEFSGHYEHEWFTGFSNTFRFRHRVLFPAGETTFILYKDGEGIPENALTTSEISLDTRFAFKEKYVMGEFERISLGTTYPVVDLKYSYGIPGFLESEFEYHKLQAGVRHWFNVFSFGWSKYIFETGKIWGTLPYPLLKLMPGNETFLFDEYAYNLLDYYEMGSDTYVSLYYTHHFDGLILNRIPLMRRLKWRTVIHGRGLVGSLTEANKAYSEFPRILGNLEKPYYEAGVGLENIFKIFRVDAIWRLSHRDTPGADNFAVFFSFWFSF